MSAPHPRRPGAAGPLGAGGSDVLVSLREGYVALGGRPVLRGVDVEVRAGEFVAVLGANGSGKSTLVRTLTGLVPLTSGELRLFGGPLGATDWRRVGYVPQRAGAVSGVPASVWEVVASGRLTHRRLLRRLGRDDRAAIDEALAVVGLADRARDGVAQLSGGQQQRVLIARALAGRPELFFLDEPTAGVDAAHQQALAEALARLADRGATIVLVAHELGPLAPLVRRAVVVRDGRVVHDGPPLPHHTSYNGHHHAEPGEPRPDHAVPVRGPLERGAR